MSRLQVKPYLEIRKLGSMLRIGHVPPTGVEILDPPEFLIELLTLLSSPTERSEAIAQLTGPAGLTLDAAESLLDQLTEARIAGAPITDASRYGRHLLYYDMIGLEPTSAQRVLSEATVGIVGTGGIGSNVGTILAAAGVGNLVLTDGDQVELSNLTRQFLYAEDSVGRRKVHVAAERLKALNSSVQITTVCAPATRELFDECLAGCDLVVLSADSPDELHEWIDDSARKLGFGYLAAGYIESFGAIGPFVLPGTTACYECFRKTGELEQYLEPGEKLGPNLNRGLQAGSYGPLNVIVAAMAANEVIRCLLGARCRSAGTRLMLDSQTYRLHSEHFPRLPDCPSCGTVSADPRWLTAPETTELADLYESDRSQDSLNALVIDQLIERCSNARPGLRALDYGCGNGQQVLMLAGSGVDVVAFDTSERMIELLRDRMPAELACKVTTVTGTQPPAAEADFDLVLCNNVLDHIANLDQVLVWIRRAVREDGTVVVTVPHPVKDGASWNRRNIRGQRHYEDLRLEEYFTEGPITKHREGPQGDIVMDSVTTHHRTIETYFAAFRNAGFLVTDLYEPQPPREAAASHPEIWAKASKIPYFIVFVLTPQITGVCR